MQVGFESAASLPLIVGRHWAYCTQDLLPLLASNVTTAVQQSRAARQVQSADYGDSGGCPQCHCRSVTVLSCPPVLGKW